MELIDTPQDPEPERVALTREQIYELGNWGAMQELVRMKQDDQDE